MPSDPVRRHEPGHARLLQTAGRHRLLHAGWRRHFAVLAVLAATSAFLYVGLSPRNVLVRADGRELDVSSYQSSDEAVLRNAGVDLEDGDRLLALETPGSALVLEVDRARNLTIVADGRTHGLRTAADTIAQALDEAGIALAQRDSVMREGVFVSPNAPIDPPTLFASGVVRAAPSMVPTVSGEREEIVRIEVRRAVPFTIVENGKEMLTTSSRQTVGQALREAGLVIGPGDRVSPEPETGLEANVRIDVQHAAPVTLVLQDGHRVVYTLAGTVNEVLEAEGIVVPTGAFVEPSLDAPVTANMRVRIIQLGSSNDVEFETVPHGTVFKTDPSLEPGETYTVEGSDGTLIRRYRIAYVDGEEVGRELIEEVLDPEPVDTVVYSPERTSAPEPVAAPEAAVAAGTLRVYAVAYNAASAGRSPDDPYYGITATGVRVTWGVVAVDPSVIPLGTKMYIPGYGYGVAADTGGAVKGYIIDLGYPDGVPIDWTAQWVDIQILE